jgi:hypothetical protein
MWFKKPPPPPPPPPPIYKRQPIATLTVALAMIGMFVLGPIGIIYKGMTEELKSKADNNTVILLIEQIKENDERQWREIENNRKQQIQAPKNFQVVEPGTTKPKVKGLNPAEYMDFIKMTPEQQNAYKQYRTDITVWP